MSTEQEKEDIIEENEVEDDNDSSGRKRGRSSYDEDVQQESLDSTKKIKTDDSSDIPPSSQVKILSQASESLVLEIPFNKVGQVIGTKGKIIQEIQARSGAKTIVNQEFPDGIPRQINMTGTLEQMSMAVELIKKVIDDGPTAIHVNNLSDDNKLIKTIECSQQQVGRIIGSGGANIKDIQAKSGAHIQIYQDFPPEQPRQIQITGSTKSVNTAVDLIKKLMENGSLNNNNNNNNTNQRDRPTPTPPSSAAQSGQMGFSDNFTRSIEVKKEFVGKIIGKGGDNIVQMQKKSGAKITVDQKTTPIKVNIIGTPQAVEIATHIVNDISNGIHPAKAGETYLSNQPPISAPSAPATPAPAMPYGMPPTMPYAMPYPMPMAYGYGYPPGQMPFPQAYPGYPAAAPGYAPYGAAAATAGANPYPQANPSANQAPASTAAPASSNYNKSSHTNSNSNAKANSSSANVWTEYKTEEGTPYWYNSQTNKSQVIQI